MVAAKLDAIPSSSNRVHANAAVLGLAAGVNSLADIQDDYSRCSHWLLRCEMSFRKVGIGHFSESEETHTEQPDSEDVFARHQIEHVQQRKKYTDAAIDELSKPYNEVGS